LRHFWILGLLLAAGLGVGCGSSRSSSTGQLRFVQASPMPGQVQLLVDSSQQASNLNYANATGYLTVKAGSRHVQVLPVSGSTSALLDKSISIKSTPNQTLLMTGASGSISSVLLNDANTTAVSGEIHVRVLNASSSMGAADVYLLAAGSSLVGATPVANGPFSFDQDTGYQTVATGGYQVVMAVPGTTKTLLSTGPLNPSSSSQNQTVVVLDNLSGGFTFIVLQDQ
jgi:uncharacterized protein DUF4397